MRLEIPVGERAIMLETGKLVSWPLSQKAVFFEARKIAGGSGDSGRCC